MSAQTQQRVTKRHVQFDYRSLNRVPTALGIERKACILGGMLALIRFHTGGGLLESTAYFLVYWGIIFGLTQWEPRLFRMLRALWHQRRLYSASKFVSE